MIKMILQKISILTYLFLYFYVHRVATPNGKNMKYFGRLAEKVETIFNINIQDVDST